MTFAVVQTRARLGMHAPSVLVEVHISNGLPAFNLVGLPDTAVRESKERVRSAILNAGLEFPQRRITVNLAPADLPKDGGRFDLAIAIGVLAASGQIVSDALEGQEFLAELALSGELRPVSGALSASLAATQSERTLLIAPENAREATLPENARVLAARHLLDLVAHLQGNDLLKPVASSAPERITGPVGPDLSDVRGQHLAKRALEVAAAGKHNLLMIGPPGAGKSMLAARLPGLLPPMTEAETLEVAAIHTLNSRSGSLRWGCRPIRTPHHTSSAGAIAGGGSNPRPGEISLAHRGILFLDELPEFPRKVLEVLREPLETGEICISRAACQVVFPANFQLVAAMNPCPCGKPTQAPEGCSNPQRCCNKYQSRLSGPLLDRIDMHLQVDAVPVAALQAPRESGSETSEVVRARVVRARERQLARCGKPNHDLDAAEVERYCALSAVDRELLGKAVDRMGLSARAYHRVLKVARTLADLAGEETISTAAVMEALSYRAVF
ncbi:Mg2+ chelatase family protein [gamma proteobacterium HdN1]|nr:Mg2+ chelatase family protein [gamma proteobacterium HdN1]